MADTSAIDLMYQMIKDNSVETDLIDKQNKIKDVAKESVAIRDAYGNSLAATGTADKVQDFTNYGLDNDTLNFTLWLALYNGSWVFRRAIDKPAQDEVRAGITLQGFSDFSKVYTKFKKHYPDFIQLLQWGALFGGSIACMMFDNVVDDEYKFPLRTDKVKQAKSMRMYVVDRWYGVSPSTETVTDMTDFDFGKPAYYDVTLADGNTVRFHHSYVLRYEHRTAPKLIKNGMLQGWGYAEGSHILNELARDDQLKSSISSLVNKALIEVIKMSGMRGVFMGADADNEQQLRKRLEMVNWGRTFNSLTFLDKDDEYQQNTFSGLNGLSDLLEKNMWLVSAALEMQGVLYGDLKQGFSNDSEALERYDETIQGRCENMVRPVYEKFLSLLYRIYDIDEPVEFSFNSILMEKQETKRIESIKNFVDLCSSLMNDGVIDTYQYGRALQNYSVKGIVDFGLTDEALEKLKDKTAEEMENIDIETE